MIRQHLTIIYPKDDAVTVGYPGAWACLGCRARLAQSVIQHQDRCPEVGSELIRRLEEKIRVQAAQLRDKDRVLERKNRELDALHMVWCDGGCPSGVHRWHDALITRDLVEAAERNTRRLRRWYRIVAFRLSLPGADAWQRKRWERAAAKTDLLPETTGENP